MKNTTVKKAIVASHTATALKMNSIITSSSRGGLRWL
jgi:hypothetical protein